MRVPSAGRGRYRSSARMSTGCLPPLPHFAACRDACSTTSGSHVAACAKGIGRSSCTVDHIASKNQRDMKTAFRHGDTLRFGPVPGCRRLERTPSPCADLGFDAIGDRRRHGGGLRHPPRSCHRLSFGPATIPHGFRHWSGLREQDSASQKHWLRSSTPKNAYALILMDSSESIPRFQFAAVKLRTIRRAPENYRSPTKAAGAGPSGKTIRCPLTSASMLGPGPVGGSVKDMPRPKIDGYACLI